MGKVELHDDHRSVSTLQSAVQHTKKKSLDSTGNTKHTILGKKWPCGIKRTDGREHAMNTKSMLPSSPGHLQDRSTFASALATVIDLFSNVPGFSWEFR